VVPDSSIFTAKKPSKMTHSYVELSVKEPQTFGPLQREKENCRMDDVSMTTVGLCINKDASTKLRPIPMKISIKINEVKNEHDYVLNKHA
jgi:hypothetical protein